MAMMKPQTLGTNVRMSFSKINEALEMPNLIEVQKKSFEWFLTEGLKEVLADVSPIVDYSGNLSIDFVDYKIDNTPKYPVEECKERDVNYAVPLKVRVRLTNRLTGEIKEQEIFMGDFPMMTENGTFVINGAERVIVSQIVRSPGIYYDSDMDKTGKKTFSATVIPFRGAWLEYESDINDVLYVRIDKNRKIPVTVLIRALGPGNDAEILNMFGENEMILNTMAKDGIAELAEKNHTTLYEEALKEIYCKLRPGDPPLVESAKTLINNLFFDARRYDISAVGRYKFNKKLALSRRIAGKKLAENAISTFTGELVAEEGEILSRATAQAIEDAGVDAVYVYGDSGKVRKVFSNGMVHASKILGYSVEEAGINEMVSGKVLSEIMAEHSDPKDVLVAMKEKKNDLIPKHITEYDIFASVNYIICLADHIGVEDDIDHLGNRRLRSVGELLQNQLRIGFLRMDKIVKERMTIQDIESVTPQALINIRPIVSAIKEFFGSSPLSQFMDQTNPLSELTHKRRCPRWVPVVCPVTALPLKCVTYTTPSTAECVPLKRLKVPTLV